MVSARGAPLQCSDKDIRGHATKTDARNRMPRAAAPTTNLSTTCDCPFSRGALSGGAEYTYPDRVTNPGHLRKTRRPVVSVVEQGGRSQEAAGQIAAKAWLKPAAALAAAGFLFY